MKRGRLPGGKVIQAVMQADSGLATAVTDANTEISHKLGTTPKTVILTPQAAGDAIEVARSATNITIKSSVTAGIDIKWTVIA